MLGQEGWFDCFARRANLKEAQCAGREGTRKPTQIEFWISPVRPEMDVEFSCWSWMLERQDVTMYRFQLYRVLRDHTVTLHHIKLKRRTRSPVVHGKPGGGSRGKEHFCSKRGYFQKRFQFQPPRNKVSTG